MAFVQEEIRHKYLDAEISVLEKEKGEVIEPYAIIDFDCDNMRSYTPKELIDLGEWLIKNATRIKSQYTSRGKKIIKPITIVP